MVGSTTSNGARISSPSLGTLGLFSFLLGLGILSYLFIELDHPFGIATGSRALYVDGGFYSDAAQNWVKFGQWSFPYDSRHWVGTPLLAVLRALTFQWFGVSLEVARLSSVLFILLGCIAFYSIARTRFDPLVAMGLTIAGVITITFTAHARSALAEPTATCFGLLAILVFVRVADKNIAIPLSLALSCASFLSKLLFLHTFITLVVMWSVELLLLPLLFKRRWNKQAILVFFVSLAVICLFFLTGKYLFQEEIATFRTMISDKRPVADISAILDYLSVSIPHIGHDTKSEVFAWSIVICAVLYAPYRLATFIASSLKNKSMKDPNRAKPLFGRAEVAMAIWLLVGFALIGSMGQRKTHYFFFAILPMCFLGAASLRLILPERLVSTAAWVLIALHIYLQIPYYVAWSKTGLHTAMFDASRDMARIIHRNNDSDTIPVMGEYSAQLGFFSDRLISLDRYWHSYPRANFCDRVDYWRPEFHVNVAVPGGGRDSQTTNAYQGCRSVSHVEELMRYPLPRPDTSLIILRRIHYRVQDTTTQ